MSEFGFKCSITETDFMIHVLNNLSEEFYVILDGLENCLTASGDDALTKKGYLQKIEPPVRTN